MRVHLTATILIATLFGADEAGADICVENGTSERLFLAADLGNVRATTWADPNDRLCAPGAGPGTVSVFLGEDVVEGCSRRIPANHVARISEYQSIDLCIWSEMPQVD